MRGARIFILCVGFAYVGLAFWCALLPETTARAVGFSLRSGSGQSEYLAVYGGLQFGLGLLFLTPLRRGTQDVRSLLLACAILHGPIVLARAASLLLYRGIDPTTYALAAVEWVLFLAAVWFARRTGGERLVSAD